MRPTSYTVYLLSSHSRRLYVGVTNDLVRRLWEHRSGYIGGFAFKYHITRLVYFETTPNVRSALTREKEIKAWSREKKIRLVESANAGWLDLSRDWFPDGAGKIPPPRVARGRDDR